MSSLTGLVVPRMAGRSAAMAETHRTELTFSNDGETAAEVFTFSAAEKAKADRQLSAPRGAYLKTVKPAVDRGLVLILLLCAVPAMAMIAAAIRLTMGNGVIYSQPRVGRNGQVFYIYKFRTMQPDRRGGTRPVEIDRRRTHKHPQDPRVTRVGRFLRKWSLDEIPQFWNVLRGDMSLVGPRPEMVTIVEGYEPWQHARHLVKPGVTGLWQVSERGGLLMHECVALDIEYVRQLSWHTDLRILMSTPSAALGRRKGF